MFHEGGYIHWLTPEPARTLPCLQMRNDLISAAALAKLLLRGWRSDKRISEIWTLPDAPRLSRAFLSLWGRLRGLEMRLWREER